MKILFIIPGSGDQFYCGNCFRDNLQASALRKAGHEVIIMPLYLPLRQKTFQADTPLFFPATVYYTAQKFFKKRKMPGWLQRIVGSDLLLKLASSLSGTTSAEGMEGMTLSMITGNDSVFKEQVAPMIEWIKKTEKPDIIHLSSSLLIGIAKVLREETNIPVICSVQDEEVWIDSLNGKYAGIAWEAIVDNIRYVDRFITTSEFYREELRKRIPEITRVEVVYPGIDREKYAPKPYPENPVIGFFYRMNRENGLDILADAFVLLKKRNTIPQLKLKIGGGYTGQDKKFLKQIRKTLRSYPEDVLILETYSLEEHMDFYNSVSVISVPIRFNEGVGLYICEAFATGRPAVEPSTGSFPEIVDQGGVLYQPNNAEALADALERILTDEKLYTKAADSAVNLSLSRYNEEVAAEKLEIIYKTVIKK